MVCLYKKLIQTCNTESSSNSAVVSLKIPRHEIRNKTLFQNFLIFFLPYVVGRVQAGCCQNTVVVAQLAY